MAAGAVLLLTDVQPAAPSVATLSKPSSRTGPAWAKDVAANRAAVRSTFFITILTPVVVIFCKKRPMAYKNVKPYRDYAKIFPSWVRLYTYNGLSFLFDARAGPRFRFCQKFRRSKKLERSKVALSTCDH